MSEDLYKEVESSRIKSPKRIKVAITTDEFHTFNSTYWEQQSVELHKCYKQGHSFANNTNKKDSVDLMKDLNYLLEQQYKNNTETPDRITLTFEIIKSCLNILKKEKIEIDKDCVLSTIQGFTIGCLKFYDGQTKN